MTEFHYPQLTHIKNPNGTIKLVILDTSQDQRQALNPDSQIKYVEAVSIFQGPNQQSFLGEFYLKAIQLKPLSGQNCPGYTAVLADLGHGEHTYYLAGEWTHQDNTDSNTFVPPTTP